MRNWNPLIKSLWQMTVKASRLPMRNWNVCSELFLPVSFCVLPDYLWGIETQALRNFLPDSPQLPDYLWGIETRIELRFFLASMGFQTTYEELKRDWTRMNGGDTSLPDYLWGIETQRTFFGSATLWLPDYLWGIETGPNLSETSRPVSASRLPMRNWNSHRAALLPCI